MTSAKPRAMPPPIPPRRAKPVQAEETESFLTWIAAELDDHATSPFLHEESVPIRRAPGARPSHLVAITVTLALAMLAVTAIVAGLTL